MHAHVMNAVDTEWVTPDDAASAPPSCFGTGHVTVLFTLPRMTEYRVNVPVHLISVLPVQNKKSKENS